MRDRESEMVDGCGRCRRWPPRRHMRSPEGERGSVEWLSGGACGPVPRVVDVAEVQQASGSLCLSAWRASRPRRRLWWWQGRSLVGTISLRRPLQLQI
jgi:hypothetical protein